MPKEDEKNDKPELKKEGLKKESLRENALREDDRKEREAAVSGAESVALAVKKVADAALEELTKTPPARLVGDFSVSGTANGSYELRANPGVSFSSGGTVTAAGMPAPASEWSTTRIFGQLPAGVLKGEVVVSIDDETHYNGWLQT